MAYKITISTLPQKVNETDTAQLIIEFDVDLVGTNQVYDARESGIRVSDWGEMIWQYDLEDSLMVPGILKVVLNDANGLLKDLFYGHTEIPMATNKRPEVTIKINGDVEYIGNVQEDGAKFRGSSRSLQLNIDPNSMVLNQKKIYNEMLNTFYDPIGLNATSQSYFAITDIIERIFKLVEPSISYSAGDITILQDWLFKGEKLYNPESGYELENIPFTELWFRKDEIFFDQGNGLNTVGEVLKRLASDWCCFTGLIHKKKAFFNKLFYFNENNLQPLGMVKDRIFGYKYGLIDFIHVSFSGFDAGRVYTRGTDSGIDERTLKFRLLNSFAGGTIQYPTPSSNVRSVSGSGLQAGEYQIYACKDVSIIDEYMENGDTFSNFWFTKRMNNKLVRTDEIYLTGVRYNFLKNFIDEGRKYQPIGLKKRIGKNETIIEGLYLGQTQVTEPFV